MASTSARVSNSQASMFFALLVQPLSVSNSAIGHVNTISLVMLGPSASLRTGFAKHLRSFVARFASMRNDMRLKAWPRRLWRLRCSFAPLRMTVLTLIQKEPSECMAHLHLFGLEVFLVVRIRLNANRNLFHHLQPITFKADDFLRIVRYKSELAHTEIEK